MAQDYSSATPAQAHADEAKHDEASARTRAQQMLHVVLYCPDIPQNTGNIGRMCAFAAVRLHLIHPLGFVIDDKALRRAGMDYWRSLDVHEHADWQAFVSSPHAPARLWLLTTHGARSFWQADYALGDGLVFGKESSGAPAWLHEALPTDHRIKVDQFAPSLRSLNLSSCAAVVTYEALRQIHVGGSIKS